MTNRKEHDKICDKIGYIAQRLLSFCLLIWFDTSSHGEGFPGWSLENQLKLNKNNLANNWKWTSRSIFKNLFHPLKLKAIWMGSETSLLTYKGPVVLHLFIFYFFNPVLFWCCRSVMSNSVLRLLFCKGPVYLIRSRTVIFRHTFHGPWDTPRRAPLTLQYVSLHRVSSWGGQDTWKI